MSAPLTRQQQAALTRQQSARFLTDHGYPISSRYFGKKCVPSIGEGPPIAYRFGGRVLYWPEDLLAWAQARSKPGDPKTAA